jgi:DNA-binding NtrC family response regulator
MENCIKRAVIMSDGPQIGADDLGLPGAPGARADAPLNLRQARDAAEYEVMVKALARSGGNIVKAAELLGVSRPTLYDLMHHHGIGHGSRPGGA